MIHSTACIDERAKVGADVFVGPGAVILGDTEVGEGSYIHNHATVGSNECRTVLGAKNMIFPGAVIGGIPQDLKYKGEKTELHIGNGNTFRECSTVNTGTKNADGKTVIGNNNLIMAYSHIAHDCILGNHIVVANSTGFAGHVIIEDHVKIGGNCTFNQFVRIGEHSYVTAESFVIKDILPYTIARGSYNAVSSATNKIGLQRANFSPEDILAIHKVIRIILKSKRSQEEVIQEIEASLKENPSSFVQRIVDFVKNSKRGLAK